MIRNFLPRQTQPARGVPSQHTMALRLVEYPSIASSHAPRTTKVLPTSPKIPVTQYNYAQIHVRRSTKVSPLASDSSGKG